MIDPSGPNLKVIYRDLTQDLSSTPSDTCYVDQVNGRFLLPRPNYWSRMESLDNIVNADIHTGFLSSPVVKETYASSSDYAPRNFQNEEKIINSGKFSNAYFIKTTSSYEGQNDTSGYCESKINIYKNSKMVSKGTLSTWIKYNLQCRKDYNGENGLSSAVIQVNFLGNYYSPLGLIFKHYKTKTTWSGYSEDRRIELSKNGNLIKDSLINVISEGEWNHIYIIWDKEKTLSYNNNTYSVLVFINGQIVLTYDGDFNTFPPFISLRTEGIASQPSAMPTKAEIYLDNLQVWSEPIISNTDAPYAWIYNSGIGREDALHPIYGSSNGYKISSTPKVGYHYLDIGNIGN